MANAAVKHSLIVGLGATGVAVARYLTAHGERVRVIDSRAAPPGLAELRAAVPNIDVSLETLDERWLEDASRVLLSPGLPYDLPLAVEARRRGIAVIGDIELFALAVRAPVIAVTGSNGKSTVTTLASKILESQRLRAPAGGNLGPPALDLLSAAEADAYVLEISSFQMETTDSLAPLAATVLNVSADHLDRHGTLELYAELKEKLLKSAEQAVVNVDDPLVAAMGARHARVVAFSVQQELKDGYSIVTRGGERWLARDRKPVLRSAELGIRGTHNEANALAALALTAELTTDMEAALGVLRTFKGLPHRCQVVAERKGVTFVDDSKGTNVGATLAALNGLAGPLVLIAGGLSKGQDLLPLAAGARGKLRGAVLIGAAADELERALGPIAKTVRATSMPDAVARAANLARRGDTVLLSPACASQDMFRDYRDRGEQFARAAQELPE
ncbi:MAG TPA: UDP-N-acetylmuramoyl-L-alanine--D-glutamate ligase [Gammaproteobacteria bacterium]|nr:UDP-N-acetylmuramoyl-L-alanine--D-glutamate ligase [Gammaproteobacteria bacterium]